MSLGISDIAVTVVEGEHGAHLNPLEARIGLGAFSFDAPRSTSMPEVASDREVVAAGWWSRMRRSGPCSAARLSHRRCWVVGVSLVRLRRSFLWLLADVEHRIIMCGWRRCHVCKMPIL